MPVYESDIPGIGRKFELPLEDGGRAIVIVHHDGRREVFRRVDPDADSEKLLDLTDPEARRLGTLLQGAYFQTVDVATLEVPVGEALMEWTDVTADGPLAGRTLDESHLRRETGVTVIAVQREEETIPNPDRDFRIEPGDVRVTLGTREEQADLEASLEAETDAETESNNG